jgi:rubrerythrin
MASFFDRMKSGITEKAAEASIRSREALETQQVRAKIGELEGQKRKIFSEIGEAAYTMYSTSSFDQEALAQRCEPITAIEAQIREKERELEEVRRRAEAAIAEQRGASASTAPASAPTPGGSGLCSNCGASLGGARFCPECGTRAG